MLVRRVSNVMAWALKGLGWGLLFRICIVIAYFIYWDILYWFQYLLAYHCRCTVSLLRSLKLFKGIIGILALIWSLVIFFLFLTIIWALTILIITIIIRFVVVHFIMTITYFLIAVTHVILFWDIQLKISSICTRQLDLRVISHFLFYFLYEFLLMITFEQILNIKLSCRPYFLLLGFYLI